MNKLEKIVLLRKVSLILSLFCLMIFIFSIFYIFIAINHVHAEDQQYWQGVSSQNTGEGEQLDTYVDSQNHVIVVIRHMDKVHPGSATIAITQIK